MGAGWGNVVWFVVWFMVLFGVFFKPKPPHFLSIFNIIIIMSLLLSVDAHGPFPACSH